MGLIMGSAWEEHGRRMGCVLWQVGRNRCVQLKKNKKTLFLDIWEKWGRHIWEKGVLGCFYLSMRFRHS